MNKRILIVEGEEKLRELYQHGLKDAGYNVDTAADGSQALKKLQQRPADVIVLDLVLPDGAGFDHLHRFLKVSEESKVVINTSHADYKSDFHSWTADAFLDKSTDITALKSAIDGILQRD